MQTIGVVIDLFLLLCIIVILGRFIIDWLRLLARDWRPSGFVAVLCELIFSVTDPPMRAVRAVIPPLNLGQMRLDLSPMILLIAVFILQAVNRALFF